MWCVWGGGPPAAQEGWKRWVSRMLRMLVKISYTSTNTYFRLSSLADLNICQPSISSRWSRKDRMRVAPSVVYVPKCCSSAPIKNLTILSSIRYHRKRPHIMHLSQRCITAYLRDIFLVLGLIPKVTKALFSLLEHFRSFVGEQIDARNWVEPLIVHKIV